MAALDRIRTRPGGSEPGDEPPLRRDAAILLAAGAGGVAALGVARATSAPDHASIVLGLLVGVVVLWVSEAVPLYVAALTVPVVLSATGVVEAPDALAPFFDPIIVLFFGGFLMARAMANTGIDRLVAAHLVARAGRSPVMLFASLVTASAFASMWMSNTAAVTVLLPVAMAITAPLEAPGYQRTVVLGIAYAATIGGVGSAIGTPANQLAITFLEDGAGREISFAGWFGFGLPLVILFLPVMGAYLWLRSGGTVEAASFGQARAAATAQAKAAGRLRSEQTQVLVVFVAVLAIWLTEAWHGLTTGIVALAGAIVLMLLGRITATDLGRISWPTLLTFGGGLALGRALVATGTAEWLIGRLGGIAGWPAWAGVLVVASASLVLTTVASNTAAAATLIPLAIPLAGLIGADPTVLVLVVALASSVDFALVVGTPPTMLAYGTGLFRAREILSIGIVLDLVGLGLVVAVLPPIWRWLGLL